MGKKTASVTIFLIVSLVMVIIVLFLPITTNEEKPSENLATAVNRLVSSKPDPPRQVSLIFGGDVMLGRTVMTKSLDINDYLYPFRLVADTLKEADIAFVNLENPFVDGCRRNYNSMVFCALPEMADGLALSGIDVVTLANNHARNYGQAGIDKTLEVLAQKEILATGMGELVVIEKAKTKFGFLGFEFLSNAPTESDYATIRDADKLVDVLVVSPHWGVEYGSPTGAQREWAKIMVKEGADLIIGHHPHVVQEYEYINSVPVYYSLGNLVFDQMWSEETRRGMLVKIVYKNKNIDSEEIIHTYIDKWAQPIIKAN